MSMNGTGTARDCCDECKQPKEFCAGHTVSLGQRIADVFRAFVGPRSAP